MGADLIAYICVGPYELDTRFALKQEIAERIAAYNKLAMPVIAAVGRGDDDDADRLYWQLVEVFEQVKFDSDLDPSTVREAPSWLEAEDFYRAWRGEFRDVASRHLHCATRIVVAGEMSWGDEPDGRGYQTLDWMFRLGVNELLGID